MSKVTIECLRTVGKQVFRTMPETDTAWHRVPGFIEKTSRWERTKWRTEVDEDHPILDNLPPHCEVVKQAVRA